MSVVRIIARPKTILQEVVSHLESVDLARTLVVFPGKRPSHVLRKMLAAQRKAGFIPPPILSYDEFIRHLSERHLGILAPDLDPLDAAALLYDIHSSRSEQLGGVHFRTFDEFLPLGLRLFDELEELHLAGADVKSIAAKVGSLTFGNKHLLSAYFEEFYRRITDQQWSTRSTRLVALARSGESLDLSAYEKIILAGFYALTPTDRQLFKQLMKNDHVVVIFEAGHGLGRHVEQLDMKGKGDSRSQMDLFANGNDEEERPREADISFYKSTDIHGQVFALSALIKELKERNEPLDERTAIVLPSSDALFPVLFQTLALLPEEGYNISLGYPLSRTPLYALLSALLDLVAGTRDGLVQTAAYIRFVLHPYIKNIRRGKRTDVTRVLFHALEDLLARRPATSVRLDALESEHLLFDRIAKGLSDEVEISASELKEHLASIHEQTIKPFLNPGTLGEFASHLADLIIFINKESTAYQHPLFSRYAEKLLAVAEKIISSGASAKQFGQLTSFATFLQSYIGPQTVPFPGTPLHGLQVLGLLETRALSFERVIVLDASDDVLPGARGTEMLIPQGMRESLGLETYHDREEMTEYYFMNLVEGAREVHLFFTENNKREKSRFVEKLLWSRMQKQGARDDVRLARYRIHLGNQDPVPLKKTTSVAAYLNEFEFSTTALDEYLKCQLRFYYRYVLGLRERDEVGDEIEQIDVGTLVHRILKSYFEPLKEKPLTVADIDIDRMVRITEETIEQMFGPNRGAIYLLKQQSVSKMKEFLESYQKKLLEGESVTIVALERGYSVVRDGHHFSGRIDRVERRGERTVILDYKIRQDDTPYKVRWRAFDPKDRATWSNAIGSLQLPMYSLLYSEQTGEPVSGISPAYLFLGRNYIDPTIETGLTKDGNITEEMHKNLHKVILELVREIKDASVPFQPTEDIKKQCPGCPYQTMCGTQWAREGRW